MKESHDDFQSDTNDQSTDCRYDFIHPSITRILLQKQDHLQVDSHHLPSQYGDTNHIGDHSKFNQSMINKTNLVIDWDILEYVVNVYQSSSEYCFKQKHQTKDHITVSKTEKKYQSENHDDNLKHYTPERNNQQDRLPDFLPIDILIILSFQCEEAVFGSDAVKQSKSNTILLPKSIKGILYQISQNEDDTDDYDAHVVVATLLLMNMVEASIRALTNKKNGRAPLLKDMIEIISQYSTSGGNNVSKISSSSSSIFPSSLYPVYLAPLLRSLLLPHGGLNLRNLLWHGFVSAIPRNWLALCIVLTISMDHLTEKMLVNRSKGRSDRSSPLESSVKEDKVETEELTLTSLRKHSKLSQLLDHGKAILYSSSSSSSTSPMPTSIKELLKRCSSKSFVPQSHSTLFRVALEHYSLEYPICFAAIMSILIEHCLRLWWCDDNSRQGSKIATPGAYYTTLDGHGQRDKHDIVLLPYISSMVNEGGSPTVRSASLNTTNKADTSGLEKKMSSATNSSTNIENGPSGSIQDSTSSNRSNHGTYTSSDNTVDDRNMLALRLGGPTLALLTDIFASPTGPNIRANIAHGLYNRCLINEMESMLQLEEDRQSDKRPRSIDGGLVNKENQQVIINMEASFITLAALQMIVTNSHGENSMTTKKNLFNSYTPIYSYAAGFIRSTDTTIQSLSLFHSLIKNNDDIIRAVSQQVGNQRDISTVVASLEKDLSILSSVEKSITMKFGLNYHDDDQSEWTIAHVMREHDFNKFLSNSGAAALLLNEVQDAISSYLNLLRCSELEQKDTNRNLSSRRRKQITRLFSMAKITYDFYSFVAFVALLYIEQLSSGTQGTKLENKFKAENKSTGSKEDETVTSTLSERDLFQVVKRARATLSTFSTSTNTDRSLKALSDFTKGKIVKTFYKNSMKSEEGI